MENEEFYVVKIWVGELNPWTSEIDDHLEYVTEAKLTKDGNVDYKTSNSREDAYHFTQKYLRILTMADSGFSQAITIYQGNTSYKKLDRIACSNNALTGNIFGL